MGKRAGNIWKISIFGIFLLIRDSLEAKGNYSIVKKEKYIMKRKISSLILALACCMMLASCGTDGSTTMDNGKDTDGVQGETPTATSGIHNATSGENGEGAQEAAENVTGGAENAADDAKRATEDVAEGAGKAVKDAADGVGNAAKDVVDGAGNAVKDAADGVTGAVDEATGKKD